MNPYEKSVLVRPRAFWLRLYTALIPISALYFLLVYDYVKFLTTFRLPMRSAAVAAVFFLTSTFLLTVLAWSLKRWIWDTVYTIVGTLRLSGRPGVVIPLGVRFMGTAGEEYITTQEQTIGVAGFVDCEVCVRWSWSQKI